ncbi:MAG: PAAR domain-containing protein [Ferruginibacter sp.]
MGKPAARIGDMHVCPMVTGLVPHVGGAVIGPGCATVLIGGMPASVMGDMCTCVGPPDTILLGSAGVMIGGKPAARMGDTCAHGGTIILGCATVLIGEVGVGMVPPPEVLEILPNKMAQIAPMIKAAQEGTPFCEVCEAARLAATAATS